MLLLIADRIPAMVSHVIDNQVEVVGQEGPERVVEINRQTVAVTQNESWSRRVSMTPQTNDGVTVHAYLINRKRSGNLPYRCRGRCQWNPLLAHKRSRREFLVAKIFRPSVEETEICSSSNPGAGTRDFKSRHTHNNPHAKRLDSCFPNYPDIKKPVRTDGKAYAGRYPMYYRTRLAMARGVEDKIPVSTIEFTQKWRRALRDTRRIGVTGLHPYIFANARVLSHRATPRHPRCRPHEMSD